MYGMTKKEEEKTYEVYRHLPYFVYMITDSCYDIKAIYNEISDEFTFALKVDDFARKYENEEELEKAIIGMIGTQGWKNYIYESLSEYIEELKSYKTVPIYNIMAKVELRMPYRLKEYQDYSNGCYYDTEEIENDIIAEIIYELHTPWYEIGTKL